MVYLGITYFKPEYGGGGEPNKPHIPKHPWGFWEGPETKLSHLTVKGEDGGGGGAGRRTGLSRLVLLVLRCP